MLVDKFSKTADKTRLLISTHNRNWQNNIYIFLETRNKNISLVWRLRICDATYNFTVPKFLKQRFNSSGLVLVCQISRKSMRCRHSKNVAKKVANKKYACGKKEILAGKNYTAKIEKDINDEETVHFQRENKINKIYKRSDWGIFHKYEFVEHHFQGHNNFQTTIVVTFKGFNFFARSFQFIFSPNERINL